MLRRRAHAAGLTPPELERVLDADSEPVRIDFVAEATQCGCGQPLEVRKSETRTVVTLEGGEMVAREVSKRCCARPTACPAQRSNELRALVPARQRYGYDLIVEAGLARYLRGRQRAEIRDALAAEHGVFISTGSISHLCDRFLAYVEALHLDRAPALRQAMRGGYPLHLDTTCDPGTGEGGLFVCLDGWRNWVLGAARVRTEREELVRPTVEQTVELFGDPVAVVRDMSSALANAVAPLKKRGVLDLICHYHFAAAVGRTLLGKRHAALRAGLRKSEVAAQLKRLLRGLEHSSAKAPEHEVSAAVVRPKLRAWLWWLIHGDTTKDPVFPFALPHLSFVRRCQRAFEQVEVWAPSPRTEAERSLVSQVLLIVAKLDSAIDDLADLVHTLEAYQHIFSELRDVLRLTEADLPRGDGRAMQPLLPGEEQARLDAIAKATTAYRKQLEYRVRHPDGVPEPIVDASRIVLRYLTDYGDALFGHPAQTDDDGTLLCLVARTNNPCEHFFGAHKQALRRRVGRAHLGRDLKAQPAQAALAQNLAHSDYVRVVCGSIESLPSAFADLDARGKGPAPGGLRNRTENEIKKTLSALLETHAPRLGTEPTSRYVAFPELPAAPTDDVPLLDPTCDDPFHDADPPDPGDAPADVTVVGDRSAANQLLDSVPTPVAPPAADAAPEPAGFTGTSRAAADAPSSSPPRNRAPLPPVPELPPDAEAACSRRAATPRPWFIKSDAAVQASPAAEAAGPPPTPDDASSSPVLASSPPPPAPARAGSNSLWFLESPDPRRGPSTPEPSSHQIS